MKIFVSSYACEPGLGSEIGVGWHWVMEMSRYFELWVLTRESNRKTIETWMGTNAAAEDSARAAKGERAVKDVHFIYYDLPKWARFWKKGLRGVRTYYNLWQKMTNSTVRRTMTDNGIKVFHHLTYGNIMWGVSSYGSKQTFIYGPVGGLETIPETFSRHYGKRQRVLEAVRRAAAKITSRSAGLKRRCKRADLILCKTEITKAMLPAEAKAIHFTDVAPECNMPEHTVNPKDDGITRYIAVGRLDAWRGFDLAILALDQAIKHGAKAHLTIVGKGPDLDRLTGMAESLGIKGHVTFTGKLTMGEYYREMQQADAVVNPALKEGAVTVSFDAMALGKPLLAIDSIGYTKYFDDRYAILVPIKDRDSVIGQLAAGMVKLSDPKLRAEMSAAAKEAAKKYNWHSHGIEIRDAILSVANDD